ncbi:putative vesicle-associated membrane protein 726 isoform X2 [Solanum tuberosum]|uniref:putative vesicle-associated membrane protein 726 isoform X2 n=1 Tax=Solanum tuberosum TaxID=4113 RepID=UPI0003D272F4|nr:PREDICTED: putative vesicle-associated membrane protein 726 isoform X2 [Solanum tuberosum]
MGQQTLIYSFVARGTIILVEYSEFAAYCVVATESAGREIPLAFLDRVKNDFSKKYAGGKAATASAKSLNREFGSKLKEHMKYCCDHPEEISKLSKVKAQVSEVKGVMMENIEKVLDRGEKIELLVDKTDNLRSQAQDFRQQGTKIRRKMWYENMKIKLVVFSIILVLILIIILSVCPGFKCTS